MAGRRRDAAGRANDGLPTGGPDKCQAHERPAGGEGAHEPGQVMMVGWREVGADKDQTLPQAEGDDDKDRARVGAGGGAKFVGKVAH